MTSRNITTTPLQELALATVVALRNVEINVQNVQRATAVPPLDPLPHVTATDYFAARVSDVLGSWAEEHKTEMASAALAAIFQMPSEQQAAVLSALGLDDILAISDPTKRAQRIEQLALAAFMDLPTDQKNAAVLLVYPE